jgi:ESCRT-II complex subunit VPS22
MNRKLVGKAALIEKRKNQEKAQAMYSEHQKEQLETMAKQLAEFKEQLESFAIKHKKDINENPVFRNQFLKMCKSIGVDPLSSNKGFWVDVLGVGDFYYELAVS